MAHECDRQTDGWMDKHCRSKRRALGAYYVALLLNESLNKHTKSTLSSTTQ